MLEERFNQGLFDFANFDVEFANRHQIGALLKKRQPINVPVSFMVKGRLQQGQFEVSDYHNGLDPYHRGEMVAKVRIGGPLHWPIVHEEYFLDRILDLARSQDCRLVGNT